MPKLISTAAPRVDARLAAGAAAAIVVADLLWRAWVGSTGHLAFALVDVPAHLATCGVLLLALSQLRGARPPAHFVVAALVASVAIDLDHLPHMAGWDAFQGALPRPYSHSLLTVAVCLALAAVLPRRRGRMIALGAAFGVATHLLRDLATGPGIPLAWPLSDGTATLPYGAFALTLAAAVLAATARLRAPARERLGAVVAVVAIAATAFAPRPTALGAGSGVQPPSTAAVATGIYVYSAGHPERLERYVRVAGRRPVLVSSYEPWPLNPFPRRELDEVWAAGAVTIVSWEPWTYRQRPIPLSAILAGDYDRYVHKAARFAAEWGRPILVRFAHEMNGNWYPWGTEGTSAVTYRKTWRKLVRIFRAEGAGNVQWVWNPNVNNGSYPFGELFPGDEWVDWVALDGFNWGRDGDWRSFTEIFGSSYEALARLSSRPFLVAETGTSESGGDKAEWVSSALDREIPRFPRLRGVVWFSEEFEGVDTRVDSSPESLRAFRRGIASAPYRVGREEFLASPRSYEGGVAAPPAPSGGFGRPSLITRLLAKLHGRNLLYAIAAGLALLALLAAAAALLVRARRRNRLLQADVH